MKKRAKKATKQKSIIFIQDHGTYSNETVCCFGGTKKDILAYLKRIKATKSAIQFVSKDFPEKYPSENGFIIYSDNGQTVLWMFPYKNCWKFWDILIHELSHLVDVVLSKQKCMSEETEARAYQIEFLFKTIRRKLMK